MTTLTEEIKLWLAGASPCIQHTDLCPPLEQVGRVDQIGDGVAMVSGLARTRLNEILRFEDGTEGIAMQVSVTGIGCVLLGPIAGISAGSRVVGTGEIVRVPVGPALLGRVIDPLGRPLDDGPPIDARHYDPIEKQAPGIVDRELVSEPLMTGITVIDAMIPLGRGQRELIIGDRKTGKTSIAVDAMINQRDSDIVCIYAAVGQKRSAVNDVIAAVRRQGRFDNCVFVAGAADAEPGVQWITPYAACSIAEYFRDRGRHALLIIDDLTKHAAIYRQLSLLLRNPPGREAYPGDIFYVHARLLERAGQLSADLGGGSLTALPVAETQAGDLSAYIPTNLISITDGQIFLEPKLFYEGQKPAINVGMSVSRVGSKTQVPVMRELAGRLRLEYAQFLELEVFTRFGTITDERSRKTIAHGRRIRAVLRQRLHDPMTLTDQIVLLLALDEGLLDEVPEADFDRFRRALRERVVAQCPQAVQRIQATGSLEPQAREDLLRFVESIRTEMVEDKPSSTAEFP